MKFLLAVDLHSTPEAVVATAADWAQRMGATLDLLHADETPVIAGYIHDPVIRDIATAEQDRMMSAHRERLDALLATVPAALRGQAILLRGNPATLISDTAAGYDGLVIATHGRTGMSRLWLGSVAERVVRTCPVPVLVLRLPDDAT